MGTYVPATICFAKLAISDIFTRKSIRICAVSLSPTCFESSFFLCSNFSLCSRTIGEISSSLLNFLRITNNSTLISPVSSPAPSVNSFQLAACSFAFSTSSSLNATTAFPSSRTVKSGIPASTTTSSFVSTSTSFFSVSTTFSTTSLLSPAFAISLPFHISSMDRTSGSFKPPSLLMTLPLSFSLL